MLQSIGHCIIDTGLEDEAGHVLRLVPVELTYTLSRDPNYGADADGNRGFVLNDVDLLDVAIDAQHLKDCSLDQVQQLLSSACWLLIKQLKEGSHVCIVKTSER